MFENMTATEYDFFERMKSAKPEQAAHFRTMLNTLMGAYGPNAPSHISMVVHKESTADIEVHALNNDALNTAIVLAAAFDAVMGSLSEAERIHVLDALRAMRDEEEGPRGTLQ